MKFSDILTGLKWRSLCKIFFNEDRRDTSTNDGFTEECFEKELPPLPDDTVDTQIIDDDFEPSSIILCRQESDNDSDSDSVTFSIFNIKCSK